MLTCKLRSLTVLPSVVSWMDWALKSFCRVVTRVLMFSLRSCRLTICFCRQNRFCVKFNRNAYICSLIYWIAKKQPCITLKYMKCQQGRNVTHILVPLVFSRPLNLLAECVVDKTKVSGQSTQRCVQALYVHSRRNADGGNYTYVHHFLLQTNTSCGQSSVLIDKTLVRENMKLK